MEDLIRDFWWLTFPIFGMGLAAFELIKAETRGISADTRRRREGE